MRDKHDIWLGAHRRNLRLRGAQAVVLQLDSKTALARALDEIQPDVIVHAAGLSNVDDCERDPGTAHAVNAELAATVAAAAAERGVKLAHISTDHLFSGTASMYSEADMPEPLNAYARSKMEGERLVARRCPRALIVRTNFFGWGHTFRKSISDWVIEGAALAKAPARFQRRVLHSDPRRASRARGAGAARRRCERHRARLR